MPAQYEIRHNRSGQFDVFWRQLFTQCELKAKSADMVKNGWAADDAQIEILAMADTFAKCTDDPKGSSLRACQEFVASYAKRGDVVVELGRVFIVNYSKSDGEFWRLYSQGEILVYDNVPYLVGKEGCA